MTWRGTYRIGVNRWWYLNWVNTEALPTSGNIFKILINCFGILWIFKWLQCTIKVTQSTWKVEISTSIFFWWCSGIRWSFDKSFRILENLFEFLWFFKCLQCTIEVTGSTWTMVKCWDIDLNFFLTILRHDMKLR